MLIKINKLASQSNQLTQKQQNETKWNLNATNKRACNL